MTSARSRVPQYVFDGPKLKVKRSAAHVNDLIGRLRTYLRTDFYRVFVQEYVEEGASAVSVEIVEPMPPEIPLIIGDAVHNLRTALDYLTVGMVQAVTGKAGKYVGFPVDESRDQAIKTRHKEIKESIPDVFDLIINDIKPFKTPDGDGFIWGLNKLDVADKHRLIVPVTQIIAIDGIYAVADNGMRVEDCGMSVTGSGALHGFFTDGKFKIERHGKPRFDVVFRNAEVFAGKPVIPTLVQIGQATVRAIDILHTYFYGKSFV